MRRERKSVSSDRRGGFDMVELSFAHEKAMEGLALTNSLKDEGGEERKNRLLEKSS